MHENNAEELRRLEGDLIKHRRDAWGEAADPTRPTIGLALSGGGIRSATFSLGVIQSLARAGRLRDLDYLSTVSGGGYTGSFIGSLFLPRRGDDLTVPDPVKVDLDTELAKPEYETAAHAARRAQDLLADEPNELEAQVRVGNAQPATVMHPLRWLRENGRYLTPRGAADTLFMAAFYLRSLLGVHYVLALALIGVALLFYTLRLALFFVWPSTGTLGLDWADLVWEQGWVWWWSPVLWLPLWVALLAGGPLLLTYWVVYRQERPHTRDLEEWSIELGPWVLVAVAALLLRWILREQPDNPLRWLLGYAIYLGIAAIVVRDAVLRLKLQSGWKSLSSKIARARLLLTRWLTAALRLALILTAIGFIDSFGQTLFVAVLRGEWAMWSGGGAGLAVIVVAMRRLAEAAARPDAGKLVQLVMRYRGAAAAVLALLALVVLAAIYAALVQAIVWSEALPEWLADVRFVAPDEVLGHNLLLGGAWVAWLVLFLLTAASLGFLNNSTFHRFYAARLIRTFLGAANLQRLRDFAKALREGDEKLARRLFVSETHEHDDIALRAYYGVPSAAPLHLINATLNESVSSTSNLQREDRKGVALCLGPAGIGVGEKFYAWQRAQPKEIGSTIVHGDPSKALCERLAVGPWAAVSGAAVSTGLGRMSSVGFAVLLWLVNGRLGYWWQPALAMVRQVPAGWRRLLPTYSLVLQEMTGAFAGRAGTRWNVSDGGHFENTAVYELIRRRVPLIVCCDNGADANYDFPDVENLVRRARIDFGADVQFLAREELRSFAKQWLPELIEGHELFGEPADYRSPDTRKRRCALLARIVYPPQVDGGPRRRSLLVLVKPNVVADAPLDVQLYQRDQPAFPQQTTGDQFFDEAQWESYRKLGVHLGERLFGDDILWKGFVAAARTMYENPA